jgi:hypothetical protein
MHEHIHALESGKRTEAWRYSHAHRARNADFTSQMGGRWLHGSSVHA